MLAALLRPWLDGARHDESASAIAVPRPCGRRIGSTPLRPRLRASGDAARFSPRRETAVGLAVYAAYLVVRQLAVEGRGERVAQRNARALVRLERRLGIHLEPRVQRALIPHRHTVVVANASYVTLNVGLTVGWLALLFARRDPRFHRLRRAWALTTLGAQPVYLAMPMAPPRGIDGFVDTIRESGIDLDHGVVARLYNPIAAMPSIHVAYAVVIGSAISETARSPLVRWAGPAYAPLVALVVLATGNHFVLDVVAGAALGAAALRVARLAEDEEAAEPSHDAAPALDLATTPRAADPPVPAQERT